MFTQQFDKRIKMTVKILVPVIGVLFLIVYFGVRNSTLDVGYRPVQPIPFSHELHSGDTSKTVTADGKKGMGIQCMYCHTTAEYSAHSPVPSTSTCMNCHVLIGLDNPKLSAVRESYENNKPIEWKRIHNLPDHVQFNHSRHIRAQIDCASCHGEIEKMGVVAQNKPLSMGWCIDCHRNPEQNIVPARPISGIFTGVKSNEYKVGSKATMASSIRPITNPQFGQFETDIPKVEIPGIPTPKHPGYGPENCSSCHY